MFVYLGFFILLYCSFFFFFFFQAEDGIRDGRVTGVQTCALPISDLRRPHLPVTLSSSRTRGSSKTPPAGGMFPGRAALPELGGRLISNRVGALRSEERRVGKECRSRWSLYQLKKKERWGEGGGG